MNSLEIHLIINHIPIFASIFGFGLLLYGTFTKHKSLLNFGLVLIIIGAILVIPTFLTGEGAEKLIDFNDTISKEALESHSEIAKIAFWLYIGLGILSGITFLANKNYEKKHTHFKVHPLVYLLIVYSAVVIFTMVYAGNTGGKIRRPEMRMQYNFNPDYLNSDTIDTKNNQVE